MLSPQASALISGPLVVVIRRHPQARTGNRESEASIRQTGNRGSAAAFQEQQVQTARPMGAELDGLLHIGGA